MVDNFQQCLEIANSVKRGINGRCADSTKNMARIAELNIRAGDGDYLEIGALFGGTAITVALARKAFGVKGKVVVLDPLDGYYLDTVDDSGRRVGSELDECGIAPSPEILKENAAKFGVDIEIVQAKSQPWPDVLWTRRFMVSYIDGDHWNDTPWQDWLMVSHRTTKYVIFDNHDRLHPAVMNAVARAAKTEGWTLRGYDGIQALLERVK